MKEKSDDLTIAYMSGSASRNDEIRKLEQERDQLQAELERYSMSAGAADQFRAEALAIRQALGFNKYGDDIAPVDLLNALAMRDAQVVRDFCSFALSKYRYDITGFADEFLSARQKSQEKQ